MRDILIGISLLWLLPWSISVTIVLIHLVKTKQIDLKGYKWLW